MSFLWAVISHDMEPLDAEYSATKVASNAASSNK